MEADAFRDMTFSVAHQIALLSKGTTLEAGSILLTGTPAGIGYTRKPSVTLRSGGEIAVQVGGIGSLINKFFFESCYRLQRQELYSLR